ncbi:MAG: DUF192 domain-containing protein [Solirubrobacterales bacterium]
MTAPPLRLRGLPPARVLGFEVPVAVTALSRFFGLALLEPDSAGPGLLLPGCRSVHTFGMRFPLTVGFLDREGGVVRMETEVEPGCILFERRASAVLELCPVIRRGEIFPALAAKPVDVARTGRARTDRRL